MEKILLHLCTMYSPIAAHSSIEWVLTTSRYCFTVGYLLSQRQQPITRLRSPKAPLPTRRSCSTITSPSSEIIGKIYLKTCVHPDIWKPSSKPNPLLPSLPTTLALPLPCLRFQCPTQLHISPSRSFPWWGKASLASANDSHSKLHVRTYLYMQEWTNVERAERRRGMFLWKWHPDDCIRC